MYTYLKLKKNLRETTHFNYREQKQNWRSLNWIGKWHRSMGTAAADVLTTPNLWPVCSPSVTLKILQKLEEADWPKGKDSKGKDTPGLYHYYFYQFTMAMARTKQTFKQSNSGSKAANHHRLQNPPPVQQPTRNIYIYFEMNTVVESNRLDQVNQQ